jgi:hypothetical protein
MQEIDAAIAYLQANGCTRGAGYWFSKHGEPLERTPIESAKLLRRLIVQRGIAASRNERGLLTRDFTPNGAR